MFFEQLELLTVIDNRLCNRKMVSRYLQGAELGRARLIPASSAEHLVQVEGSHRAVTDVGAEGQF